METSIIFTVINIAILFLSGLIAYRRVGFQNISDDANAAKSFRDTAISLQAEIVELKEKNKLIEEHLDRSHLQVAIEITMGKAPTISSWKWLRRADDIPPEDEGKV